MTEIKEIKKIDFESIKDKNINGWIDPRIHGKIEELDVEDNDRDFQEILDAINDMTVSDDYITEDFDYENYQRELELVLASVDSDRNKVAMAAKFLACYFPKLPYFWGGGHEVSVDDLVGINENWGRMDEVIYGGSDSYPVGEEFPYSLDCSAFVSWCLINAGYDIDKCLGSDDCKDMGESVSVTAPGVIDRVQVGDFGYMTGHVGVVIDVNKVTNEVTFAHVSNSGKGMNVTTISTETGLVTRDEQGVTEDKYGNKVDTDNRVNQVYFTDIVLVPYED